ncbi:MAG: hypothetical protein HQL53_09795 [Magnetococcales bacterium]|nr:hypothetical protein [Magnetococcales bacterium]
MQEFEIRDLLFVAYSYLRGMWRHRWHMVMMSWFICLAGWGAVSLMDDQYKAQGRILIEDPQRDIEVFLGNDLRAEIDVTAEARRILNSLLNRANLIRVVQETDLALRVKNQNDLEEVIQRLRAQLTLRPTRNNIYLISHRSNEPALTVQVVRVLLNILMQGSIDQMSNSKARTAEKFLEQQIKEYEAKVTDQERELRDFKSKNRFSLPKGRDGYYDHLRTVTEELDEANTKLRNLELRRNEAQKQRLSLEDNITPVKDIVQVIGRLNKQLLALQSQHYLKGGQMMPLFPEGHPDVIALQTRITNQKKAMVERLQEVQAVRNDPSRWDEGGVDPAYRLASVAVSKLDVDLLQLREEVQTLEGKLSSLRKLEGEIPTVEVELISMESQYSMTKSRLMELMKRRTDTVFKSEVAEGLSKDVRFKVMEQPRLPTVPFGPNRPLFLSVVLMGGLLAGAALSLFLSVVRSVFDSPAALKKELGLPVLGTVSMLDEDKKRSAWQSSNLLFFLSLFLLLGIYGGFMMFSHLM